jgi:geranylgeranylglycerol-phosphate geranylgeranyltransferase
MASAGALVGGHLVETPYDMTRLTLAAVVVFCVCAAGNVCNDLVDLATDRVSHPDRALACGAVPAQIAVATAIVYSLMGLVLSILVSLQLLWVAMVAVALLLAYNFGLKRVPFVGNLVVGLLGGLTFLAGGLAVDSDLAWHLPGPLVGAVFGLLFHVVREVLKDVEDIEGDRAAGITTLPQVIGERGALALGLVLFAALVFATIVPIYLSWFGRAYEIITIYAIDLPLLLLLIFIWGNPTARLLRIGSLSLKGGMLLGLVALLLSSYGL